MVLEQLTCADHHNHDRKARDFRCIAEVLEQRANGPKLGSEAEDGYVEDYPVGKKLGCVILEVTHEVEYYGEDGDLEHVYGDIDNDGCDAKGRGSVVGEAFVA